MVYRCLRECAWRVAATGNFEVPRLTPPSTCTPTVSGVLRTTVLPRPYPDLSWLVDADSDIIQGLTAALSNASLLSTCRAVVGNEVLLPVAALTPDREFCPSARVRDAMRDRVRDNDDAVRAGVLEAGEKTRTCARLLDEQTRWVPYRVHHTSSGSGVGYQPPTRLCGASGTQHHSPGPHMPFRAYFCHVQACRGEAVACCSCGTPSGGHLHPLPAACSWLMVVAAMWALQPPRSHPRFPTTTP